MATRFEDAPEVEAIARRLIAEHHSYLRQSDIRYLWRISESEWTKGGHDVYGQTALVSGPMRHIAEDADAVVLVNHMAWGDLSVSQRVALVDHELSHLVPKMDADGVTLSHPDGRPILVLARHDVEEFAAVIRRHGLWRPELERAAEAFRAVPLDLGLEGPPQVWAKRDVDQDTGEVRDIEISAPGMEPVRTNLREMRAVADGVLAAGRQRRAAT